MCARGSSSLFCFRPPKASPTQSPEKQWDWAALKQPNVMFHNFLDPGLILPDHFFLYDLEKHQTTQLKQKHASIWNWISFKYTKEVKFCWTKPGPKFNHKAVRKCQTIFYTHWAATVEILPKTMALWLKIKNKPSFPHKPEATACGLLCCCSKNGRPREKPRTASTVMAVWVWPLVDGFWGGPSRTPAPLASAQGLQAAWPETPRCGPRWT